jgi:hypothetical protein
MNAFRGQMVRMNAVYFLLVAILIFTACVKKAKMVQIGASQFEAESLAAIEKIDELRRKETEAAPLPQAQASKLFVDGVKNSTGNISLTMLKTILDPLKLETRKSEAQWQAFLQKMRQQYTTFIATFATLDKGSFFAASDVKMAIPILDKLITQMTAFAKSIAENPAVFIRERSAIAEEMEFVRDNKPHTEVTDLKLLELERRLRELVAAEALITRDAIEQTLKAATLGSELRKLLVNYDQLSRDDIAEGLSVAFKLTAGIPGVDLSSLEAKTTNLIEEINEDAELQTLFSVALDQVNAARANSGQ